MTVVIITAAQNIIPGKFVDKSFLIERLIAMPYDY